MNSAGRFGPAARHKLPQSRYICLQCRLRTSAAIRTTDSSISLYYPPRRYASWLSTDKLRKKIWGTETPPGQADPYARESESHRATREGDESAPENKPDLGPDLGPEDDYVPATTAEGLKWVGGHGWGKAEWEAENPFQGFMESEKTEHRKGVVIAVHRALVETYALREAGLPITMDYYALDPTKDYAKRVAEGAQFQHDEDGNILLVLESEELRRSILQCVTPQEHDDGAIEATGTEEEEFEEEELEEEEVEEAAFEKEEAESRGAEATPLEAVKEDDDTKVESEDSERRIIDEDPLDPATSLDVVAQAPASDTWRNVSLEDAAIKFAVLKRVMQLTGKRIPDPDISAISTPGSLVVHLVKQPKPEKIADVLRKSNPIVQLPNVQLLKKRYGAIDRDNEVGRWKVIKKELEKRGLPIIGKSAVRNTRLE